MKLKYSFRKHIQLSPGLLEIQIEKYLKRNFYRITDRGEGYIIFIDDEYSDRKRPRSDYHTRIGEGKFEFDQEGDGSTLRLIYFTDILFPFLMTMAFCAVGMWVKSITPIIMSTFFSLPVLLKIFYLNEHVIDDILNA